MATIKKKPLHNVIFWEWPDDALQLYNAIDHSVFKSVPSHLKINKKIIRGLDSRSDTQL